MEQVVLGFFLFHGLFEILDSDWSVRAFATVCCYVEQAVAMDDVIRGKQ